MTQPSRKTKPASLSKDERMKFYEIGRIRKIRLAHDIEEYLSEQLSDRHDRLWVLANEMARVVRSIRGKDGRMLAGHIMGQFIGRYIDPHWRKEAIAEYEESIKATAPILEVFPDIVKSWNDAPLLRVTPSDKMPERGRRT